MWASILAVGFTLGQGPRENILGQGQQHVWSYEVGLGVGGGQEAGDMARQSGEGLGSESPKSIWVGGDLLSPLAALWKKDRQGGQGEVSLEPGKR